MGRPKMGNREVLQGLGRLLPDVHHGRGDARRVDAAREATDAGERLARDGRSALSAWVATALLLGVLPRLLGAGAARLRAVWALDLLPFLRPEQIERLAGWALDGGCGGEAIDRGPSGSGRPSCRGPPRPAW
ncbi:hypothetical protein WMF45_45800 [Sorangium sp. So ce448]|uniref:hypothetical protein n=1 Tax=Sorangium sp. So ce448 TaxID=3133314 RepID=UPI003F647FAC